MVGGGKTEWVLLYQLLSDWRLTFYREMSHESHDCPLSPCPVRQRELEPPTLFMFLSKPTQLPTVYV